MTTRFLTAPLGARLLGAALVLAAATGAACAQDVAYARTSGYGHRSPYGQAFPDGHDQGYGYGGALVEGAYVGAPLTRVPRPSELVPSAWGYGTYGIPTVAGIRSTRPGTPTVYVIEAPRAEARGTIRSRSAMSRSRVVVRDRRGRWSEPARQTGPASVQAAPDAAEMSGGARVIPVRVSHR